MPAVCPCCLFVVVKLRSFPSPGLLVCGACLVSWRRDSEQDPAPQPRSQAGLDRGCMEAGLGVTLELPGACTSSPLSLPARLLEVLTSVWTY